MKKIHGNRQRLPHFTGTGLVGLVHLSQSLIKTICYPTLFKVNTAATEHGCKNEKLAISKYEDMMKAKHAHFKPERCEIFIHAEYQWLHATPDFLCSCDCCGLGCGEVKCPFCLKDSEFVEYVKKRNSCLDDKFLLKKSHQYYYQVQQQLFITGRAFCDFVVCKTNGSNADHIIERIQPDTNHWNSVLPKLTQFSRFCVLPEILGKWYTQKREINVPKTSPDAVCF